ncbi:MAG TPA: hypothetical protein VGA98_07545 [Allosphingosinicella sp.]
MTGKHFPHDLARDKLDRRFGPGEAAAHEAIRTIPAARAIYDCAVEAIVEAEREAGLSEARKRLETEIALVKLIKAIDREEGYDIPTLRDEAEALLDRCNEDPPAVLVPLGWVATPEAPTAEMLVAGRKQTFADVTGPHLGPSAENTYRAMIEARPKTRGGRHPNEAALETAALLWSREDVISGIGESPVKADIIRRYRSGFHDQGLGVGIRVRAFKAGFVAAQ